MQFCKECGSKINVGMAFCNECGTSVGETKKESVTPKVAPVAPTPKKPMSKKTKMMLVIGGAAAVLLFGGYKVGEALTSEIRLIENFETALNENNAKAISKLLSSNDKKLEINEKNVKGLLTYYKENPEEIRNTIDILEAQAKIATSEELPKDAEMQDLLGSFVGEGLVNLEKDGKILFYDKFEINIDPVYLQLGTNYKDTVLYVDGEEIGKADKPNYESTFGPFVPGYHKIEAKLKTDFVDLVAEDEVMFSRVNDKQNEYINIEADEVTVSLPGGMEGKANLFINGKDVGVDLVENQTFGPVLTDGSMKLSVEAEFPWGKVTSAETPISGDYVNVNFANEEVSKQLMDTVHKHFNEYSEAYTTADASKFTTATKEYVQEVISDAQSDKGEGRIVKMQYVSTNFDLDTIEMEYGGEWVAYIRGERKSNVYYGYEGDEVQEMEEDLSSHQFSLQYDEVKKKWLVTDISSTYGLDLENAKELVVKEPKTFTSNWSKATEETVEASAAPTSDVKFSNSGEAPGYLVKLTEGYMNGLVNAVNKNDFSLVEPYLLKGSELYTMQKDLVKNLAEKGVKEEIVSVDITKFWVDGGEAIAYTDETIKITYADGTSETKDYKWAYKGVLDPESEEMLFEAIVKVD